MGPSIMSLVLAWEPQLKGLFKVRCRAGSRRQALVALVLGPTGERLWSWSCLSVFVAQRRAMGGMVGSKKVGLYLHDGYSTGRGSTECPPRLTATSTNAP